MSTAITGPGTPYVTPEILKSSPTGISWGTLPKRDATASAQRAAILNMCEIATAFVDETCNQVIRATVDTEQLQGPDFRITIQNRGLVRVTLSRWPVTQVLAGQITSTNVFPRTWNAIPGNMYDIETPIIGMFGTNTPTGAGDGGQVVVLAPGYLDWRNGRNGYTLRTTYINGWPHAGLTQAAAAGATALVVDDVTGWGPISAGGQGATGSIRDGENQETVTVLTTSTLMGPGTLTLASPLANDHEVGVAVTTIPETLSWAATLHCASQALSRGATATGVQSANAGSTGGSASPQTLEDKARKLCKSFARVW
jgi:hypothetical protein